MMRPFLILMAAIALSACHSVFPQTPATTPSESTAPAAPLTAADGEMCGGIAGIACTDGSFCKQEDFSCTEIADNAGVCTPIRAMCTREFRPVCGCDGETYSNKCTAHASGISVASAGPCSP